MITKIKFLCSTVNCPANVYRPTVCSLGRLIQLSHFPDALILGDVDYMTNVRTSFRLLFLVKSLYRARNIQVLPNPVVKLTKEAKQSNLTFVAMASRHVIINQTLSSHVLKGCPQQ